MNTLSSKEDILNNLRRTIKDIESSKDGSLYNDTVTDQLRLNLSSTSSLKICKNSNATSWRKCKDPNPISSEKNKESNPAFQKLVHLLSFKEYSSYGMKNRLSQYDYSCDDIENAINYAREISLINDDRYARSFVYINISKGKGIKGIKKELMQQHIDLNTIEGWCEELSDIDKDERKRAYHALDKKAFSSKNSFRRAYNFLYRRGFEASIAYEVARQWCFDHHELSR